MSDEELEQARLYAICLCKLTPEEQVLLEDPARYASIKDCAKKFRLIHKLYDLIEKEKARSNPGP